MVKLQISKDLQDLSISWTSRYHSYGYYVNGNKYNNNTAPSYGDAWTTDIIGIALDLDNHKLYFSKNGVWQNRNGNR